MSAGHIKRTPKFKLIMTKTIIILTSDVTTVHPDVGFTARFAQDAEDAEMDK